MSNLLEAHWFPLTSQGNVYSMTKLCSANGSNKVLVASLKRKIYSCEYHQTAVPRYLRPLVKELLFTYIPSGAEIVSIDVYNKSEAGDGFVIGITILKPTDTSVERYLNIYTEGVGEGEGDEGSSIEAIAQNCLMVELAYTPYHLYHTVILREDSTREVVWLISGSDHKIHMIREDETTHGYAESQIDKYFPELSNLEAIALWIDIFYYKNHTWRLSAVGCECGLAKISLVNVQQSMVVSEWSLRYDYPVSSVRIFPHRENLQKPSFLSTDDSEDEELELNIIVANTSTAVVFMDVLHRGLDKDLTLTAMDTSDCILCCCIADVNMDGTNEILLGTYSQEMLIFAYNADNDGWELTNRRLFDAPIHSICYMDLSGDGMKELVILTQRGVHILQHDPKNVRDRWTKLFTKFITSRS